MQRFNHSLQRIGENEEVMLAAGKAGRQHHHLWVPIALKTAAFRYGSLLQYNRGVS